MFTEEDKILLSNPDFSLPLEKFYDDFYYREKNGRNGTLTQAYPFSNEKLHDLFKHLKKKNPRVLTVGSSGDQLFYSLYYGSKDVTVIDANLYAKPWIEYKMSAIKNLSFDEFNNHFLITKDSNQTPFNNDILTRIFQDLSEESKQFWGTIFLSNYTPEEVYSSILERRDSNKNRTFSIFYKDKSAYKKLQEIIENHDYKLNFITEEFSNFSSAIAGKFDIILLSNIRRYVGDLPFIQTVNNLYKYHLNNNGIIQLHYDYHNVSNKKSPKFDQLFPDKKISGYGFKDYHYTYLMHKPNNRKNEIQEEMSAD